MNIPFKNLDITFTLIQADFSGDALLTIPSQYLPSFLEDIDGCQHGEDDIEQWVENCEAGEIEDFYCSNTDLQIIFMSWAMEQKETISFDYEGENLFWLYHDFHHAMHDVTGIEIYVDGGIEAERHYQAIKMLKENNQLGLVTAELFYNIKKEFGQRAEWASNFEADDFDLEKALELAEIEKEVIDSCTMCGCELEAEEITQEERESDEDIEDYHTHKCTECEYIGEEHEFKYEMEYDLY